MDAPNPIEVRALTKRYRSLEALRGVDPTVHPGDVVGFLGRNGAGKSTTIRILMGITQPTGGSVSMFGETLAEVVIPPATNQCFGIHSATVEEAGCNLRCGTA